MFTIDKILKMSHNQQKTWLKSDAGNTIYMVAIWNPDKSCEFFSDNLGKQSDVYDISTLDSLYKSGQCNSTYSISSPYTNTASTNGICIHF